MKTNRTILIAGPMVLISIFLISSFSNTSDSERRMLEAKENMVADWTWAKEYTLSYIEAMPEDGINYRPSDSVRSFAEQMLHITSADVGFTAAAFGVPPTIENVQGLEKDESLKNKQALKEVVGKGYDFVIQSIEAADESTMGDEVTLFGRFTMARETALHKAFIHQNHHRGQTAVYIRMAGGVPPQMRLF